MEQKDMYTMRELFDNLEITMTELVKRSGISDVTLGKIRAGKSARRDTMNTLLRIFSDIYGIKLSLNNINGIMIQGKPVSPITEKVEKAPVSASMPKHTQATPEHPKRDYKPRDTKLPDGCILAKDFALAHGIAYTTFRDHMNRGLGPGLIGESTDMIPERDRVAHEERPKPGRPKEKEKYLTADQQRAALQFWQRHKVAYNVCDQAECPCHTLKNGE